MEKRVLSMVRMSEPHHDDGGLLFASGPTVPTDATAGYRTGCIFQHSDGGEGTALYLNEGTVSSCDFNAIAALTAAQEALLGATAGTVTASMAVIVDANKDIGTFRDVTGRSFSSTGAIATGLSVVGATTSGLAVTTSTPTQGILISAACSTAAINISGAEAIGLSINTSTPTDGINIAAACANGIAIGGANTTAGINISGAEAVGLSINTSTPTDGILISAACANGISISGANTTAGIGISGAEVLGISIDTSTPTSGIQISAACETAALDITGAEAVGISINTSTPTDGILISAACANGISLSGANTTAGLNISGAEAIGISINTSTPTDGINIAAACANAIAISGANTVAGVSVSGDQVLGYLFHATAAATAAFAVTIPTGITLDAGMDINATSTGVVTSGLTMQGTGTFTTGITLSATAITTGIAISAGSMTDAIKISGTTPVDGIEISSACSANAINISGSSAVGLYIAATTGDAIKISGPNVLIGMRIGAFAGSAATSSAVLFAAGQDIYTDGQLSTAEIHGGTNADLGSGYCAKCLRARHIVNSTNCAHETYGVMGQVVVKDTTLTHLHSGLIGTFEGHTSGVVVNSAYTYGAAAVMARVGGGAAITGTTAVAGFSSFLNGADLASGVSCAFAACDQGTAEWQVGLAVSRCTALVAVPAAGTNPVTAAAVAMNGATSEGYVTITVGGAAKKVYYFA